MKSVEQTGNVYQHTQAVGYQQSPQVSRVENPVCNEPATSALLTQQQEMAKQPQLQQLVQQVEDIKPKVSHGIVTGENGSFTRVVWVNHIFHLLNGHQRSHYVHHETNFPDCFLVE